MVHTPALGAVVLLHVLRSALLCQAQALLCARECAHCGVQALIQCLHPPVLVTDYSDTCLRA